MEKSNVLALSVVVLMGGFVVGSWDAKTQARGPVLPAAAAPEAAPAAAPSPEPAAAPSAPAPTAAAIAPSAPSPSPAPTPPKSAGGLDNQTDEGAGKGIDVAKPNWRVLVGPRRLDAAQIAWWEQALKRMNASEEWKKTLESEYWFDSFTVGAELARFIENEFIEDKSVLGDLGMAK